MDALVLGSRMMTDIDDINDFDFAICKLLPRIDL